MRVFLTIFKISMAGVLIGGVGCAHNSSKLPEDVTRTVSFEKEVKPILTTQCLPCHHSGTALSVYSLETREQAFTDGKYGPPIVPGFPESSRVWFFLSTEHATKAAEDMMPSNGPRLTDEEKNRIYRWIEQGAHWPVDEAGQLTPLQDPHQA